MEAHGVKNNLELQISMELPTETTYGWQWVINLAAEMESSTPQRIMEPHGLLQHTIGLIKISVELLTGMVLSLRSEIREPSSPQQMEQHGLI